MHEKGQGFKALPFFCVWETSPHFLGILLSIIFRFKSMLRRHLLFGVILWGGFVPFALGSQLETAQKC